ncbi:MAG: GlcG/HbpS family heme-binding protein [Burkholderiaceae bacterium]
MNRLSIRVLAAGILALGVGAPLVAGAEDEATVTYRQMTPEAAGKAATAALADCRRQGFQVAVAVVDRAGLLQFFIRDRFAGPHTVRVAQEKAWTSASFKIPTSELARATKPDSPESGIRHVPGVMVNGGGMPIQAAGSLVGAIGVSGAPGGPADEACAVAGIDAISDDLQF